MGSKKRCERETIITKQHNNHNGWHVIKATTALENKKYLALEFCMKKKLKEKFQRKKIQINYFPISFFFKESSFLLFLPVQWEWSQGKGKHATTHLAAGSSKNFPRARRKGLETISLEKGNDERGRE